MNRILRILSMKKDVNGYIQMDDRDYWTLVEMTNKFRDENHRPDKKNKKKSNTFNRFKPFFRR